METTSISVVSGYLLEMITTVSVFKETYRTDIAISHSSNQSDALADIISQVRTFYLIKSLITLDPKWDEAINHGNYNTFECLANDLIEAYLQYSSHTPEKGEGSPDIILRVNSIKVYRITDNNVKLLYNI